MSRPALSKTSLVTSAVVLAALAAIPAATRAQTAPAAAPAAAAPAKAPEALVVYFDSGHATVRPQDEAVLDQASRLYRDGKPIVMVVTGQSDSVGAPDKNLQLSQARADMVLKALVARGIPAERFQLVAKGATDPSVPTAPGVAELRNRRVEITWR